METKYTTIEQRIDAARQAMKQQDYLVAERETLGGWREIKQVYRNLGGDDLVKNTLAGYNSQLVEIENQIRKKGFSPTYESAKESATLGLEQILGIDRVGKLGNAARDMANDAKKKDFPDVGHAVKPKEGVQETRH